MKSKRIWWSWGLASLTLLPFFVTQALGYVLALNPDNVTIFHPLTAVCLLILVALNILLADLYERRDSDDDPRVNR